MGEHLVAEDGIRYLRRMHQIHFEQAGLEVPLLRLVVLKRIEQERSRGLDHVLRHEDVDDLQGF